MSTSSSNSGTAEMWPVEVTPDLAKRLGVDPGPALAEARDNGSGMFNLYRDGVYLGGTDEARAPTDATEVPE